MGHNESTSLGLGDAGNGKDREGDEELPFFQRPMIRYFTITAVFGFLALVALAVYCVIAHIQRQREIRQNRQAHSMVRIDSTGGSRKYPHGAVGAGPEDSTGTSSRPKYAVPLIMRAYSQKR